MPARDHSRQPRIVLVHVPDDDPDNDAATPVNAPGLKRMLDALDEEERFQGQLVKSSEKSRATSAAHRYEHLLEDHYADDRSFFIWDENRSFDRQDFDFLFYHRSHFKPWARTYLEIIASKLTHESLNGEDGYFNKLEKNVGWAAHITPIVFGTYRYTDNLVRCGLWSSAKNSRRFRKPDLCPLCLWNDHLKVLVEAYCEGSGAFAKAQAWWFLTLGFTSNENNSKWIVKDFDPHIPNPGDGERGYDPYPIQLGPNRHDPMDPWMGYDDARILGLIVQDALDQLYQSHLVDGYRNKLEGAFLLQPQAETRMNLHGHAIANGSETNGDFIAEQLYALMQQGLCKYRRHLWHDYFPDVQVCPLASGADLERCFIYSEKILPVAGIVADAMAKPQARRENGTWDPAYAIGLEISLCQLLNEDFPNVFTKFRYDQELLHLRRRKTVGNMTFSDAGTCIGSEPKWHKKIRQKRAAEQKKKREERRQAQAEAKANGTLVMERKQQQRTRENPRRLKRSLRR